MSSVLEDYPYGVDIINADYNGLTSTAAKQALYVRRNNDSYVFENPLYSTSPKTKNASESRADNGLQMRAKDFLSSIPSFADFTDQQLVVLEQKSSLRQFKNGDVVFRQGEEGDSFYVINQGAADVLIQDDKDLLRRGELGRVVNRLTEGCYFGERALMTSELRAASIRVNSEAMVCLVFSRAVYEEIISGSNALIGQDINANVDWSKDHETRSLFRHIENVLEIDTMHTSPKIKRILYELTTAFTPELSADEVISRMVMTVKIALKVDRVGLFVLSEDRKSMVLKISERSKGVRLPIRGLAGAVVQTNSAINIPDAYQDSRFDATMDRRTGYRTRQVLGVPLRHPLSQEAIGLLQVNNRLDGSFEGFSTEAQRVLELAAEQLSELLYGRADVFIHSGGVGAQKSYGQGVGDGLVLLNSAEVKEQFQVEVGNVNLGKYASEVVRREAVLSLEVHVSLHQALGELCWMRSVTVDLPVHASSATEAAAGGSGSGVGNRSSSSSFKNSKVLSKELEDIVVSIRKRLAFDILVSDVPRAARLLVKLWGFKKKAKSVSSASGEGKHTSIGNGSRGSPVIGNNGNSSNGAASEATLAAGGIFLGWTASTVFDFKGCVDCMQNLRLFPPSSHIVEVPINTTLNNAHDLLAGQIGIVLAPSQVLVGDSATPRVRIVHSMPLRNEPLEGDSSNGADLSDARGKELDRILQLSFNPLSASMMTQTDKDFLWDLRYSLLNRAELLPAFVMSVNWSQSEQVQELYDLIDLWQPPSPVQALQLLDRRFMDPKVRAYGVHCLESLPDDQLVLYMLQLCQQLKFESHIDSALARFLLRRALMQPRLLGHIYFWLLQSEVGNKDVSKRFIILLQVYIRNCGSHRIELGHQMFVMKRLENVAEAVKLGDSKEARKEIMRDRLNEIVLPTTFKLPLNPHLTLCSIDVSRCRVMESKKKPLWLTLKDTKGADIVLMLKVGDDLRQDALIMQLLRVMDDLWRREGLDMQMMLYDCISTGFERGLLQVVLNATTLGNILQEATDKNSGKGKAKSGSLTRKLRAAMKALSDFSVMGNWIMDQVNKELGEDASADEKGEEYERRVQNFMISSAAYCVASYVLGLGDRHNDNLMITKSAHFFHIDFGHILGNFKSKMGVKRERAPFVFTHAMKAVMSGPDQYESFVDLCCDVYNILREHSMLLVSLFSLAIPCNLPELQEEKDVLWIYEKLLVGADDETAAEHFRKQLDISLKTRGTRINDAAHMLAHA